MRHLSAENDNMHCALYTRHPASDSQSLLWCGLSGAGAKHSSHIFDPGMLWILVWLNNCSRNKNRAWQPTFHATWAHTAGTWLTNLNSRKWSLETLKFTNVTIDLNLEEYLWNLWIVLPHISSKISWSRPMLENSYSARPYYVRV